MTPYYEADGITIYHGDCLEVMAGMAGASVDAVVTDPPYGLEFMGKEWDGGDGFRRSLNANDTSRNDPFGRASRTSPEYRAGKVFEVWCEAWGREALRVAKPGAHLLAFGAPRTSHRLVAGLEDAGWEIRDTLAWMFGSGFPKSLNLGDGRGTALKPAYEPVVLARKPLGGTVAATVAEHGTGALNIDACRLGGGDAQWKRSIPENSIPKFGPIYAKDRWTIEQMARGANTEGNPAGRWPANVVLDEAAAAMLDAAVGEAGAGGKASGPTLTGPRAATPAFGARSGTSAEPAFYGDSGGPSRFFYTAKASRSEREAGLAHLEPARRTDGRESDIENPRLRTSERRNHHPTVKPVSLMRWLVRLVTPPGGVVLDPFMGSGSTRIAAQAEGVRFIGIEQDGEYLEIAVSRLAQLGMALGVET